MTTLAQFQTTSIRRGGRRWGQEPARPHWVDELMSDATRIRVENLGDGLTVAVSNSPCFRLVRARVQGAAELGPAEFEAATIAAYSAIAGRLALAPRRHPVRFWNYIPSIHQPSGDGIDRYMVFNTGRYEVCRRWLAKRSNTPPRGRDFERRLPTATGVGHDGADLVIDALAATKPGIPIENPRQVPAYRYTRRFGPRPPCFARATLLRGNSQITPMILIGGTASVVGEESMHVGNVEAQSRQTLLNLASLLQAADAACAMPASSRRMIPGARAKFVVSDNLNILRRFRELRVYYRRPRDAAAIRRIVAAAFQPDTRIEYQRADICRHELLVEIEGLAQCAAKGDLKAGVHG